MRTIILFIINLLVGVWCGLHSANAAPLPGMPVADVHSKSAAEEVGWRRRWYRGYAYPVPYAYYLPAYTYYPPPPPV